MSATATEVQAPVQSPPAQATTDPTPAPPTATESAGNAATTPPSSGSTGKQAKSKESKGKKAKGSKSEKDTTESSDSPSVAAHPRAARAVARTKGWGALAGFFIAGYLSLSTGTLAETGLRALVAGSVCYVVAWGGAVFVWRRLIMIEIKGREQQLLGDAQPAPAQSESPAASFEQSRTRAAS
ncbi:MAG TPA: hypothetical protein VIJ39_09820 [Solirubrobacteraceae bacterium]